MKLARVAPIKRTYPAPAARCIGCGSFGAWLCVHCRELQDAVRERVAKLWSTVENCFATRKA